MIAIAPQPKHTPPERGAALSEKQFLDDQGHAGQGRQYQNCFPEDREQLAHGSSLKHEDDPGLSGPGAARPSIGRRALSSAYRPAAILTRSKAPSIVAKEQKHGKEGPEWPENRVRVLLGLRMPDRGLAVSLGKPVAAVGHVEGKRHE